MFQKVGLNYSLQQNLCNVIQTISNLFISEQNPEKCDATEADRSSGRLEHNNYMLNAELLLIYKSFKYLLLNLLNQKRFYGR
jgi:hypothetical protein